METAASDRRVCARCGQVIGDYEPAWVEDPNDGTLRRSSLQDLDERMRAAAPQVWHAHCVVGDALT
jgi:hypothetical protein